MLGFKEDIKIRGAWCSWQIGSGLQCMHLRSLHVDADVHGTQLESVVSSERNGRGARDAHLEPGLQVK